MNNNSNGVNTILLVIILVIIVGGGVWWYKTYGPGAPKQEQNNGLQLNVGGTTGSNG